MSAWWNTTIAMGSTFLQSCVDFAATPKPWDSKEETLIHSSHSISTHGGLKITDEKIQFFKKCKSCREFSLSRPQTGNTSFMTKKILNLCNSYHLYSPKGRLPWSTPPLPGTGQYFQWFDPVQILTRGSHTGTTALLQALSTLCTIGKRIKSKTRKSANSYIPTDELAAVSDWFLENLSRKRCMFQIVHPLKRTASFSPLYKQLLPRPVQQRFFWTH